MTKYNSIVCLLLFVILLTGCGTKQITCNNNIADDTDNIYNSNITASSDTGVSDVPDKWAADGVKGTENLTDVLSGGITQEPKVPGPASANSVNWECGVYYSDISYEGITAFLNMLKEDGWKELQGNELPAEIPAGTSQYSLSRDNRLLQMLINLNDKYNTISNSILIRKDASIDIDLIINRPDAVTKSEAGDKIQQYVEHAAVSGEIPIAYNKVAGVFEIYIDEAYDKLKLQAFAAVSDNGFYGCFLIRKGVVSYVPGNLDNACIADIDDDGIYELLDTFTSREGGITRCALAAYEYINPPYFNSLTEILQVKYSNCFVPKEGYEGLNLEKSDDKSVKLLRNGEDYGPIRVSGTTLVPENMKNFPFELWSEYYDQDILKSIDKVIPEVPPDITISIDKTTVCYAVEETSWNGIKNDYRIADAFRNITEKGWFIPTFKLSDRIETDISLPVVIDFGSSIPDSILIYDAMLNADGSLRYTENLIWKQFFKIVDNSHIQFDLTQHMSYFLSSNSGDYEKDWYRMFRLVCTWGDKECTYAFLINTGNKEKLPQ